MGPVLAPFAQQTTSVDGVLCSIAAHEDDEDEADDTAQTCKATAEALAASSQPDPAASDVNIDELLDLPLAKSAAEDESDVEAMLVDVLKPSKAPASDSQTVSLRRPQGDLRGMTLGALGAHLGRHGLDVEQGFMLMASDAPATADISLDSAHPQGSAARHLTLYLPTSRARKEEVPQSVTSASASTSGAPSQPDAEDQRHAAQAATIDALRAQGKDARSILDAAASEHRPQPSPSASKRAREAHGAAAGAEFLELELGLAGTASASAAHVAQLLLNGARSAARSSA